MMLRSTVLVLIFTSLSIVCVVGDLKVAAFNIRIFGKAKVEDKAAFETIIKIVGRYDLILIQEIRDASGEAIMELLEELNKEKEEYGMAISDRLGRSSSKEQYAYIYRDQELSIEDTYQYPVSRDQFERPPYCVKVKTKTSELREFSLIGVHTSPSAAFEEINALKHVHDTLKTRWKTDDIMIMGDLNAGCGYVSKKKLSELELRSPEFFWLIGDDVDTTVSASDCPYDRFILSGNRFLEAVVPGSAGIFNFAEKYSLTDEEAKDVSDHYPIEFSLQSSSTSAGTKANGVLIEAANWLLSKLEL